MWYVENPNELYHYGVKGMKWGKHIKRTYNELGGTERRVWKAEQKHANNMIDPKSRFGYAYQRDKEVLNQYKVDERYIPTASGSEYWRQGKKNAEEAVKVREDMISYQNKMADEAYKKYSSTPIGKVESAINNLSSKVKNWINSIFTTKVTIKDYPSGKTIVSKTKKGW